MQQLQELLLVDEPWIAAFDGIGGEGKKHFVESSSEALKVWKTPDTFKLTLAPGLRFDLSRAQEDKWPRRDT